MAFFIAAIWAKPWRTGRLKEITVLLNLGQFDNVHLLMCHSVNALTTK